MLLCAISFALMCRSRIQSLDASSIHFSQPCEKVQLGRRCSSLSARVSRLSKNSGGKFVSATRIVASRYVLAQKRVNFDFIVVKSLFSGTK